MDGAAIIGSLVTPGLDSQTAAIGYFHSTWDEKTQTMTVTSPEGKVVLDVSAKQNQRKP